MNLDEGVQFSKSALLVELDLTDHSYLKQFYMYLKLILQLNTVQLKLSLFFFNISNTSFISNPY